MSGNPIVRQANPDADQKSIWEIIKPVFRAGETYPLPQKISESDALDYWFSPAHYVYVCEDSEGLVLGTYYLRPNQPGRGSHVCNCGYMVGASAQGRGVATFMCEHSQAVAIELGFEAMQFNFVVAENTRAIALWHRLGFETIGRLPRAFDHPARGKVDALVMFKELR